MVNNQKKKCYNYDKEGHFAKDCQQPKKLLWKPIFQKNVNITNIEYNITMVEWISFPIDFGNIFISILINISDIELKENLDTDESKNFNAGI